MDMRRCTKCNELKPATLEYFYKDRETLRTVCKECRKGYDREWHKNNPEHFREWHKNNPEYNRKWNKTNKERRAVYSSRRRARERALPDTYTNNDWQHALDYFDGMCAVCGRPAGLYHTLAMDHWIPITSDDCPGTIPSNMIPLCHGDGGCNNSKHKRDAVEWLTATHGKRRAKAIVARIDAYIQSLQ